MFIGYAGRDRSRGRGGQADPVRARWSGPDPRRPRPTQLAPDGRQPRIPEAMAGWSTSTGRWRSAWGSASTSTDAQAASGFDRLFVLGARAGAPTPPTAPASWRRCSRTTRRSRNGLRPRPAGHADEQHRGRPAGYTRCDDPDESYDDFFVHGPDRRPGRLARTSGDGQWLAEHPRRRPRRSSARRRTRRRTRPGRGPGDEHRPVAGDARLLDGDDDVAASSPTTPSTGHARFFNRFVLGAGLVPAIRIGRQPYGILPDDRVLAAAAGRSRGTSTASGATPFLAAAARRLVDARRRLGPAWPNRSPTSAWPATTAPAALLDIVGLHPASVEFHQRYAESLARAVQPAQPHGLGWLLFALTLRGRPGDVEAGSSCCRPGLGCTGEEPTRASSTSLPRPPHLLLGDLCGRPAAVGDRAGPPYTDRRPQLPRMARPGGHGTSLDALHRQDGSPTTGRRRAAVPACCATRSQLGYHDVSIELTRRAGDSVDPDQMRRRPQRAPVPPRRRAGRPTREPLRQLLYRGRGGDHRRRRTCSSASSSREPRSSRSTPATCASSCGAVERLAGADRAAGAGVRRPRRLLLVPARRMALGLLVHYPARGDAQRLTRRRRGGPRAGSTSVPTGGWRTCGPKPRDAEPVDARRGPGATSACPPTRR